MKGGPVGGVEAEGAESEGENQRGLSRTGRCEGGGEGRSGWWGGGGKQRGGVQKCPEKSKRTRVHKNFKPYSASCSNQGLINNPNGKKRYRKSRDTINF